jgi:hypothetical protein
VRQRRAANGHFLGLDLCHRIWAIKKP